MNSQSRAFLGFGGNLDAPLQRFRAARDSLAAHELITSVSSSPLYRTPPIGGPQGQSDYLNAVIEIETGLTASDLLQLCRHIEDLAGRTREVHWGPRTLDIDLLLYAEQIIATPELTLPHPRLHQRHFVLMPLCDLDRTLVHPVLHLTTGELLERLPPAKGITQIQEVW
ncbi:MAG: 2-amino-4-hydroxy-6-hydroxymethyldihydropteridine diphosphokinase [Desulfuromonadales bacterium]|nr:2-amino-4-hydroxy-6-hydroxymethyldihydropteridine diphosphokinase [Desulfuromonadales bacterium]MBN2792842.1 2-amino-4-hydroxy-6-hydroxymethyldihydropteridine diphosphokinase [Desulfuromonadales bacterium]